MARPIKPTAVKEFSGTARVDRLNAAEPKLPSSVPMMPATLSPAAKKVWPKIIGAINHLGVITQADVMALEGLSECYAELLAARKALTARGSTTYEAVTKTGTIIRPYPEVTQVSDLDRRFRSWLAAFGATPSDRSRVSVNPDNGDDEDELFIN